MTRVQVLSQQLARQANDAAGGNIDAFASLEQTRSTIEDLLNGLKKGDVQAGITVTRASTDLRAISARSIKPGRSSTPMSAKILDSQQQVLGTAATSRRLQPQDRGAQFAHG